MGAYSSRPNMKIESHADVNEFISYCTASVQGWRISQEDAHINKLFFDQESKSCLFGVFDGHGGPEVARYIAANFQEILEDNENFKAMPKNVAKALKDAFLKLDARIAEPQTRAALEELASEDEMSDDEDEEGIKALCEEADEPIEKLIEKYGGEDSIPEETKMLLDIRRKSQLLKDDKVTENKDDEKADKSVEKDNEADEKVLEETENKDDVELDLNGKSEDAEEKDDEEEDEEDDDDDEEDEEDSLDDDSEDDCSEDSEEDVKNMFGDGIPGFSSGSTACVCLIVPDKKTQKVRLVTANAGDSRAVLCRDGKYIDLSLDHKPEDEKELARIKSAGGSVNDEGRVCGGLNLSRAIGDHSYKKREDLSLSEQIITADPDVCEVELDPKLDRFIVIACDGIWNSMTSQEVIDFVKARLDDNSLIRKCRKEFPDPSDSECDDDDESEEDSEEENAEDDDKEMKTDGEENKEEAKKESDDEIKKTAKNLLKKLNGKKKDSKQENGDEEKEKNGEETTKPELPLPTDQAGILREIVEDLFHYIVADKTSPDAVGCDNMTCSIIMLNDLESYAKQATAELEDINPALPDQTMNTTDVVVKKRKANEVEENQDAKRIKT